MASITPNRRRNKHGEMVRNGWRVHWRDDQQHQHSKYFKLKSDALLFRDQTDLTSRKVNRRNDVPTLATVFDQWQSSRRVSRARLSTDQSLSGHFGELAAESVDLITASMIKTWIAGLVDQGLSAETIAATLRVVRAVLNSALDDELISTNPSTRARAPKITRPPLDAGDVFTQDELAKLVSLTPERWRALIALLGYVGPRWSEALGLRVRDLDILHKRVHLGRQVAEEVQSKIRLRPTPKTSSSNRVVPLPSVVIKELEAHLARHPAGPDDLIFRNEAGTTPLRGNFRQRVWTPARAKLAAARITEVLPAPVAETVAELSPADLIKWALADESLAGIRATSESLARVERVRLRVREVLAIPTRNLRHTAASLMFWAGLQPLEVAQRLGHARPAITLNVYARLIPRTSTEDVDPYDAALGVQQIVQQEGDPQGSRVIPADPS